MNYREVLHQGEALLRERAIPDAETDAFLLLEYVTGLDRAHYLLSGGEECPAKDQKAFQGLIARRAEHMPLQYLTGRQEFMGYGFLVDESVLIPRQDTEILVQETERRLRPGAAVLDLCTGSGCIAVSLALRNPVFVTASDLSGEALAVAGKNAGRLGAAVKFIKGDLFENILESYDCIVSNPPYIEREELEQLMPEVRLHEPRLALDGGPDGLEIYRRIAAEAAAHLRNGGFLALEIGCRQAAQVAGLLHQAGFDRTEVVKDLAGLDRVVIARNSSEVREYV